MRKLSPRHRGTSRRSSKQGGVGSNREMKDMMIESGISIPKSIPDLRQMILSKRRDCMIEILFKIREVKIVADHRHRSEFPHLISDPATENRLGG